MRYLSTRDASLSLSAAEAIARGLSREGGLFLPERIPSVDMDFIRSLGELDYAGRAAKVMGLFLEDFTPGELEEYARAAYARERFGPDPAPLRRADERTAILELWHGPTCAFKDMALQIMPRLLTASLKKTGEKKQVCILVATSGDTGKAALEGFRDVPGTKILVFYPSDGVSDVQKLQMQTQAGENVGVSGVYGNFDDAQNGVKAIFSDAELRARLEEAGWFFSSANSINWGRLLPQVAYYFSAYCDAAAQGLCAWGEELNYCVPTGNFGNILAGWIAKHMGLPAGKLICASNTNHILTDFLSTGVYDRNRPFHCTISPSMDILISSNLERLLYAVTGSDEAVRDFMGRLSAEGRYSVPGTLLNRLQEDFACGWASEEETEAAIRRMYGGGCLLDPHSAVAWEVLEQYRRTSGDPRPAVVVSTASPYKFCDSVLRAIGHGEPGSGTELIQRLSQVTGTPVPAPLAGLDRRERRFTGAVEKTGMVSAVLDMLGLN